ncbi:MAG: ABC transporter permease [Pirellulales bacterium]|nr:ABC transporter permease [Pirellulales bacterium]
MSSLRLIIASLRYHGRMNVAVACGVAVGTAVLVGALLVGDSMRGSLRHLTLDRLGRIDEVLLTDRFFRAELAAELAADPAFAEHFADAVPAILLRVSLDNADAPAPRRATRVQLIGCHQRFWQLGSGQPPQPPRQREIVLNRPLAERLGARVGDRVIVRLPSTGSIPAESPLGRKTETVEGSPVTVCAIVPAEGLGRFSLRPSQQLPLDAYVAIDWLAERLDRPGRVNAILVAGKSGDADPAPRSEGVAQRALRPTLGDYGIRVEQAPRGYLNITSDRMLLEPKAESAIRAALAGRTVQPALTYLANKIDTQPRQYTPTDKHGIPYSMIAAVDLTEVPPLGPLLTVEGKPLGPWDDADAPRKKIVLNDWAADDLHAAVGDSVYVRYFEPESTHGQPREQTIEFELAAVVQMTGAADDRHLTPEVAGVTDQEAIDDWQVPFSPFYAGWLRGPEPGERYGKDDQYWRSHGPTPKAFVSPATGRELWSSRFGQTTSLRVVPEGITAEQLKEKLQLDPAVFGLIFQPLKRQGLAASAGSTPFNVLFLAFSFFIIAAAVMLVALLFRLGIEQRAGELGILVAVGFGRRQITRLLVAEGLLVAALGSLAGVPAGVGYAALMLLGLRTWWLAAVVTPFLRLYVAPSSLVIGFASGLIVATVAIAWAVWQTRRLAPRRLLAGQLSDTGSLVPSRRGRYVGRAAWALLLAAVAIGLAAMGLSEEAQAGAFFAAGAMVLIASLTMVWLRLRTGTTGAAVTVGRGNLVRMATRNAARNPGRSTLTIGLVASACFLIAAVSSFQLDPTQQTPTLASGNGGFALVAESDQPVYHDLNTPGGRAELGLSAADAELLAGKGTATISLPVKPGDDASCLNLYEPRQPRILGIPRSLIDRGGFAWAGSSAATPEQAANPWLLLERDLGRDDDGAPLVPVVLDVNTAMYALHLWKGVGETYDVADSRGETIRLKVVGLLAGSILQGDLLIGETAFRRHFPEVSGFRFFLVVTPPANTAPLAAVLERDLGDYGLAAETTGRRLARFLAVQNTYLLTFQSLGGLGLLLGTFGLAVVQLRNVLERRGELALLRASGFRRATLAQMVMLENGLLLGAGLGSGLLAALIAVLPHLLTRGATVPWASLAGTLALVLVVGLIAGLAAVRAALHAPLLATLRQEH